MHSQDYYKKLRAKYTPDNIRVIFLLESPPASGKYFYDPNGKTNELLFSAMMDHIKFKPSDKESGLNKFKELGYVVVDSIYEPVNKIKDKKIRNKQIVMNIPNLINDLESLKSPRTKIVLIKRNINLIFNNVLDSIGYRVINLEIPFPDVFHRKEFLNKINQL